MGDAEAETVGNPGRMVLPSLVISRFATMPPGIVTGLLLIDIGESFGQAVGVTGQVGTAASIVGVLSALLISALSLRFRPKSLLIGGLGLLVASTAGCILAPSFTVLLAVYALTGMAGSLVGPMAFTLVAEHFPPEQRANALSWIIAGMSGAHLVGAPIIGYISGFVGWRGSFLWFVLPVSMLGLFLAVRFVPSGQENKGERGEGAGLMEGFKGVLTNTSAVACLAGTAFISAAYMAMVSYAPSYYREQFGLSTAQASLLVIGSSVCFISGTRICGRLVSRFGRKTTMLWPAALAALSIFAYLNIPNLWLSTGARFLGSTFSAIVFTAANALTLEQVPRFRGTVMSLSQATFSLGGVLGTGLGGLIVLLSGYQAMGFSHGAMMLMAMLILFFLAKEPQP
ncbi:MFS transporter [Candidatus Bathyarchaeota archaeon]|nr:MFS transporter [Candidatus Bathyarchaeota archaeon]MBL7078828.1 MFS transporter [Candidatus Bathyarchaeota archaeon]